MIAVLLLSAATSALVGSMLSAPTLGAKSQQDQLTSEAITTLANELRNYVTNDPTPVAGCAANPVSGCPPGSPSGSWHLNGDSNPGWALALGPHDGSAFLPPQLSGPPYGQTLTYAVSCNPVGSCDCTNSLCAVTFTTTWNLPP